MSTVRIPLTQGKYALVDEQDAERVRAFKWCAHRQDGDRWYAVRSMDSLALHRFILGDAPGLEIDHRNGDGLDCRRANIRRATSSQNKANRRKHRGNIVPYKGVYRCTNGPRWRAQLTINRKPIHLGTFDTQEDAARVYDDAARRYHGEFACVNFPRDGERGAM